MIKQKILFAKIEAPTYSSDAIVRGWEENGFEVIGFDWQYNRFNYGTDGMRNNILKLAKETTPDLIFLHIQNSEALDLGTIDKLQEIAPVIQYTFDVRTKEKTEWMYEYAKHVHFTFFGCFEDIKECISRGIMNVGFLSSSADYSIYKPYPIKKSGAEIVFIGNNYANSGLEFECAQERQNMIEFLQKEYGSNFRAYGLGQQGGLVNMQQEAMIYNQAKIAISQNNFNRIWYTSDRLYRILGCGTLALTNHYGGIEKTFEKATHLDWWNNFDELKSLIDHYLANEGERKIIAEIGRMKAVEDETWTNRILQVKLELNG